MITTCIISFIIVASIIRCTILLMNHQRYEKPRNNVHFYVARDKSGCLYLHIGKPFRDNFEFSNNLEMYYRLHSDSFKYFSLNEHDYDNLTWEDEPVEVFINMEY